jgi:long-subunit acyl-CoA synthetase (AMP-forming)
VYLQSPFIDQIFVTHADLVKYQQTSIIAVVIPRLSMALEWAKESNVALPSDTNALLSLCENEAFKSFLLQEMVRLGRKKGLRTFEIPFDIILDHTSWTVESGLRTSSSKYEPDCCPNLGYPISDL